MLGDAFGHPSAGLLTENTTEREQKDTSLRSVCRLHPSTETFGVCCTPRFPRTLRPREKKLTVNDPSHSSSCESSHHVSCHGIPATWSVLTIHPEEAPCCLGHRAHRSRPFIWIISKDDRCTVPRQSTIGFSPPHLSSGIVERAPDCRHSEFSACVCPPCTRELPTTHHRLFPLNTFAGFGCAIMLPRTVANPSM